MTFLREDGHRPTQDELQLMHVHLDAKQPSFVDCYAPVYETLQYSPSIAFQSNLQSHANTKNGFFPNISKDAQQSILTKNQRAQAINDVQSQMIASKIPLCLVQDIYGRLHQLVYMIPQNLYDQFSNNIQVGKKVTLRSHYETLQSKRKSGTETSTCESKESDLSSAKITEQQQQTQKHQQQQQRIVLQTHKKNNDVMQQQETQNQQQLLLQQQNQQKQQEVLLQYQKQQLQSQKQQQQQQLHQQQQLQQQIQHQHQLQHELQHKLQQQLQQHLLLFLQPQTQATPPFLPPKQQLDQPELQMHQQNLQSQQNPKHQNQDQQQVLQSPPQQQHMQHQLQQLALQENWIKDKTIVSTCDMTKTEKPVFASADSSTEFQYTLKVKPPTDNSEEIPRDIFSETSNKNSSKLQTVSLSAYLELDSNVQPNEASSLTLHSVKKAKTNDPTQFCESSSINIINARKRKSSDYEEDIKKSNLTYKENNFEKIFIEEAITSINDDTLVSEENQESIWNSFWDEISSTSNDSEIFISEELSFTNNNRLLDSSYMHTKDDRSNNNDFVEEYNKHDYLQCEPLDQFDLFQHILM